jgi:hypothetical protein
VVSEALVATQRCGEYISAAVNQHATIHVSVFSVRVAPRLYNEDLRQLRHRIVPVPEFQVSSQSRVELCEVD